MRNTINTITWNKTGTQDANVKIQLFKDGIRTLDITPGAPNNGTFDWAIPATLANGIYTIRVTTLDGKVKGTSKSFTIARGVIQVMDPPAGALGSGESPMPSPGAGRGPSTPASRSNCTRERPW